MNERMKFDPAEAEKKGRIEAMKLICATVNRMYATQKDALLRGCLCEAVGLAAESRIEEAEAMLHSFLLFIGDHLSQGISVENRCLMIGEALSHTETEGGEL